jgi:hypothetical protein
LTTLHASEISKIGAVKNPVILVKKSAERGRIEVICLPAVSIATADIKKNPATASETGAAPMYEWAALVASRKAAATPTIGDRETCCAMR